MAIQRQNPKDTPPTGVVMQEFGKKKGSRAQQIQTSADFRWMRLHVWCFSHYNLPKCALFHPIPLLAGLCWIAIKLATLTTKDKPMGLLEGIWHFLNFLAPAWGVGCIAATLAKLLWWEPLRPVAWFQLALWGSSSAALSLVSGLLLTGHDGKIVTYAAMVVSCAVAMWWVAWR
jgi:hypothetical protein